MANISDLIYEVAADNIESDNMGNPVMIDALKEDLFTSDIEYALDVAGYNYVYEFVLDYLDDVPVRELEL